MNKGGEVLQIDWSWSNEDDCMKSAETFQTGEQAKRVMNQVINQTHAKWNDLYVYFFQ